MSEVSPQSHEILARDIYSLARAVRVAVCCLLLALCYLNFRAASSIPSFSSTYRDMLAGKPLPASTQLVLAGSWVFTALSYLFPAAALASLFMRNLPRSFYILAAVALLSMAMLIYLCHALLAPIRAIVTNLSPSM